MAVFIFRGYSPSMQVCLQISPFYKDIGQVRLGLTLKTSFSLVRPYPQIGSYFGVLGPRTSTWIGRNEGETSTTMQKSLLEKQYQEDRILFITGFKFNKLQLTILFGILIWLKKFMTYDFSHFKNHGSLAYFEKVGSKKVLSKLIICIFPILSCVHAIPEPAIPSD